MWTGGKKSIQETPPRREEGKDKVWRVFRRQEEKRGKTQSAWCALPGFFRVSSWYSGTIIIYKMALQVGVSLKISISGPHT